MLTSATRSKQVLSQPLRPDSADVACDNHRGRTSQSNGFSSGCGARVVDRCSRRKAGKPGQQCLGGILDYETAITVARELRWTALISQQAGLVRRRLYVKAAPAPQLGECRAVQAGRLQDESGFAVVPVEETFGLLPAERLKPAFDQPLGMGVALG